jgi:hypothetical protein
MASSAVTLPVDTPRPTGQASVRRSHAVARVLPRLPEGSTMQEEVAECCRNRFLIVVTASITSPISSCRCTCHGTMILLLGCAFPRSLIYDTQLTRRCLWWQWIVSIDKTVRDVFPEDYQCEWTDKSSLPPTLLCCEKKAISHLVNCYCLALRNIQCPWLSWEATLV